MFPSLSSTKTHRKPVKISLKLKYPAKHYQKKTLEKPTENITKNSPYEPRKIQLKPHCKHNTRHKILSQTPQEINPEKFSQYLLKQKKKQYQKLTIRTLMKHTKKAQKKPTESLYKTQPTQEISQPKSAINFIEKRPQTQKHCSSK